MGIIYIIKNLISNKVYIGQTRQKLKDRWYRHCQTSNLSKAETNMAIKKAILKYGKENFSVEILEQCPIDKLDERERYYIEKFDSYNKGYNNTLGGQDGGICPFKISEEHHKDIINLYKEGLSLREISKEYDVDKKTIKYVLERHNVKLYKTRAYKFSEEERQKMVDDVKSGMSRQEVILKYNVSKAYLSQLLSGSRRI